MSKYLPHFHWHNSVDHTAELIGLPLIGLGGLLVASGAVDGSFPAVAVGVIGVIAGLGLRKA
ncbi:hypothetical protein RAM80_25650 [Pseudomonas sp. App30]|uniref:hypothetical protein n=1 Tax=Pseudomonas sp. App30 TaxID=3068990 RepID=UPI003A805847